MSDLVYFKKSKLDTLADKINEKCGGVAEPLSLDEMVNKIDNISPSGNEMTFQLGSIGTADDNNTGYFELPHSIEDIREFEIKFKYHTSHTNYTNYFLGNYKTGNNIFVISSNKPTSLSPKIQFRVSSASVEIPFDLDWHIAKIKDNKLYLDDIVSATEINWDDLSSLGNLHIFNTPQSASILSCKSIAYVKITNSSNETETYYPWIIDKEFALVSEKNKITSDKFFLFEASDEIVDEYETNKDLWDTHSVIYNWNFNPSQFFRYNPYIVCVPNFLIDTVTRGDIFANCRNLQRATVGEVTYLNFSNCNKLKEISFTNTKIAGLIGSFQNCYNLIKITGLNTANRTTQGELDFQLAFEYCSSLKDTDTFFSNCTFDFSNVSSINGMFRYCFSLTHCSLKLSAKKNINGVFQDCVNLITVDYLDCSETANLQSAFNNCYNLKNIPTLDTTNGTNFSAMFSNCQSIETIKKLDLSKSSGANYQSLMFSNCYNLKNVEFVENSIKYTLSFAESSLLTEESVQSIIDGLATVTTAQTITFHKDIALTDTQKQTINEKGWTLVQ